MARIYDNWERLVDATIRREQLRLSALRTPSDLSLAASVSSSPSSSFRFSDFNFPIISVGDSFSYEQILRATGNLNESNLIKRGHSGDLFYGVFEDGIQVVVKKIEISSSVKRELAFISEVEVLGKVSHSRLVPFLGHCFENMKEGFLVYKYMPFKDLFSLYYKKTAPEHHEDLTSLDWIKRLKIAIGAAEGLCYLHNHCHPPLVHRDIQASSILLDDNFEVRLGSLTQVCSEEKDRTSPNTIARFLRLSKGSEQGTSGSGTSPENNRFVEAEKSYQRGEILAHPNLKIFTYSELMVATRDFAEDTVLGRGEHGRVYQGWLDNKSNSDTPSVIAVKKLDSKETLGFGKWKSVLNTLGRLSHPNVTKLLGYCSKNNELLLVYEFMQKGSLENHLFRRDSAVQPLPWNIRFEILIGAARGLAFLHASELYGFFTQKGRRQGFYQFFEPSNILLDSSYNAKISGFTVANVYPPEVVDGKHPFFYVTGRYVYCAPECSPLSGDYLLSVKNDVYGFGVVLIEMLTGLSAKSKYGLVHSAKSEFTAKGNLENLMDPLLEGKYPSKAALQMAYLAIRCLQNSPEARPSMKNVVEALEHI
ncbi:probable serine/threonine-protein kinase PIX13 isoform X4 [Coffea eugenioides]|uniref:probable serine/threonine-protein kinase PIX13 isoform X4 n=1 Tax=Coffea eugenioides TaxID=49369 RepID=UPI000F60F4BF|nr:probable serine/threonine-protein kinase PIX13 isoform X4 [Coffea eugenioides]